MIDYEESFYEMYNSLTTFINPEKIIGNLEEILKLIDKILKTRELVQQKQKIKSFNLINLSKILWENYLFPVKVNKTNQINESIQSHIYSICEQTLSDSQEFSSYIYQKIEDLIVKQKQNPPSGQVSQQKKTIEYKGIKNLACICYMISILQVFFTTHAFKHLVLCIEDDKEDKIEVHKNRQYDDNFLHQLQRMFTYLQFSQAEEYDSAEFCASYKDYSGLPVNITLQQDASEFIVQFFDKLETGIADSPFKSIAKNIFGGDILELFVCTNCNHQRVKTDSQFIITCKVKNIHNLYESLSKINETEIINDYKCDSCQQKVNLTKQQFLNTLPNTLIIQLLRITYDFDLDCNVKYDNRVEFPFKLDLKDYCQKDESKDDIYYQYILKGIVMHSGNADMGHYYSFINTEGDKWLEFNDSLVKEFDPKDIPSECFGNIGYANSYNNCNDMMDNYSKNAYILVYDKVLKNPIQLESQKKEELEIIQKNLNINKEYKYLKKDDKHILEIDNDQIQQSYNMKYQDEIMGKNQVYHQQQQFYNTQFLEFCLQIFNLISVQDISQPQKYDYLILIQDLLFILIQYFYNQQLITKLLDILKNLIISVPLYINKYFQETVLIKKSQYFDIMINNSNKHLREIYTQLFAQIINSIIESNDLQLKNNAEGLEKDVVNILKEFQGMLKTEIAKNWLKSNQALQFWDYFCSGGDAQKNYLIREDFIPRIADFILQKNSIFPESLYGPTIHIMGNNYSNGPFTYLLLSVNKLYMYQLQNKIPLSNNSKKCLNSIVFIEKFLDEQINCMDLIQTLIKKKQFSMDFCRVILNGLLKNDFSNYVDIIKIYLCLDDELQGLRIEWLLGYPQLKYKSQYQYKINKPDSQQVKYISYIGKNIFNSLLEIIYGNLVGYKASNSILLQHVLFQAAAENQVVYDYLVKLQAPCHMYAKYIDVIEYNILKDLQPPTYSHISSNVDVQLQKVQKETINYINQIYAKIEENQQFQEPLLQTSYKKIKKDSSEDSDTEEVVYPLNKNVTSVKNFSFYDLYIYGEITKINKKTEVEINEDLTLVQNYQTVAMIKSLPTNDDKGNQTWPSQLIFSSDKRQFYHAQITTVAETSNLFQIVQIDNLLHHNNHKRTTQIELEDVLQHECISQFEIINNSSKYYNINFQVENVKQVQEKNFVPTEVNLEVKPQNMSTICCIQKKFLEYEFPEEGFQYSITCEQIEINQKNNISFNNISNNTNDANIDDGECADDEGDHEIWNTEIGD